MKKILVIEDDYTIREFILELLTLEGFSVMSAADGSVGIRLAKDHLPDLILCDVMMPHLDGYEVLTQLRHNDSTAAIPFIFLTASGSKEAFRQGMDLGADDFLTKPCTSTELLSAIASRFEKQAAVVSQSQKQLDSLRSSIALSLPHELRTPLNGILGLAEILIDDYDRIKPKETLELARGIHGAAERLYRLIQNFLLYAELEISLRDPDRIQTFRNGETQLPQKLIAEVARSVTKQAQRETDLHLNLQDATIQISAIHLKKIVEELTDNAFKFSVAGSPVQIATVATDRGLKLTITDHGRGMTAEQLTQLGAYVQFERKFYEQQGSGLGFTIAKRLVELHGGDLTIESIPGQHTIVEVTFPGSVG